MCQIVQKELHLKIQSFYDLGFFVVYCHFLYTFIRTHFIYLMTHKGQNPVIGRKIDQSLKI